MNRRKFIKSVAAAGLFLPAATGILKARQFPYILIQPQSSGGGTFGPPPTPDLDEWLFHGDYTDSVGGHNLTANGSPGFTTDQNGTVNQAVLLDGTSQNFYYSSATILDFTSQDFSFSFWLNPADVTSPQFIVWQGDFQTDGYYIFLNANEILFQSNQAGTTTAQVSKAVITTTSTWYNVVVTRTGATAKIYINGADQTDTHAPITDPVHSFQTFGVAGYNPNSGLTDLLHGSLSKLCVYSTALTASDAANINHAR